MKKLLIALALISSGAALADSWYKDTTDKAAKKIQALKEQQQKAVEQHAAEMQKMQDKIDAEHQKIMERQGTMRKGPNTKYYVHVKEPRG